MTNYKQNKNNSWENLTGELSQLKWANPDLHLIPINIIFNQTPYLKSGGIIGKFDVDFLTGFYLARTHYR